MTKAHVKSVTWWTEFLILHKRRMYATRKTYIPNGTDSERTKRKKKDRVYGSRRTYKAAIERAKRNNNNLLSSKASSTVYKLCGRRIAPKVVITMPKNRRDGERNWWTWKKYARGLLDYLIPDNMPDIIAAKYRDGGELPMMDKIPPFYKVKVKHGMRNGKMQNPIRIVQDQDS